jgi:hypothetical protein
MQRGSTANGGVLHRSAGSEAQGEGGRSAQPPNSEAVAALRSLVLQLTGRIQDLQQELRQGGGEQSVAVGGAAAQASPGKASLELGGDGAGAARMGNSDVSPEKAAAPQKKPRLSQEEVCPAVFFFGFARAPS